MNYNNIRNKINNDEYVDKPITPLYNKNYIFDENKSVKWNRLKVDELNKKAELANKNRFSGTQAFKADIVKYIKTHGLNETQSNKIMDKAWEDSHSYGYLSVLETADDLVDFVLQIIGK